MDTERKTAVQWILDNIEGMESLSPEVCNAISDFALMWSLFESSEINGSRDFTNEIPNISSRVSRSSNINLQHLDYYFSFWRKRYIEEDKTNEKFQHLINYIDNNHNNEISMVLLKEENSTIDKITCLIRIIYRLRNNLFHGNKNIIYLGGQRENIEHAVSTLQLFLENSGRFVFMGVKI